jgi:hypothetical protein
MRPGIAEKVSEMNPASKAAVHAQVLVSGCTQVEHCMTAIFAQPLKQSRSPWRNALE